VAEFVGNSDNLLVFYMDSIRNLTTKESTLLEYLVANASVRFPPDWMNGLRARPIDDGKMGSLLLIPNGILIAERKFGQRVSEVRFLDVDGVSVLASLNLDDAGNLFELDIWKTDFNPLIDIPDQFNL
jgi:hypothetical protein